MHHLSDLFLLCKKGDSKWHESKSCIFLVSFLSFRVKQFPKISEHSLFSFLLGYNPALKCSALIFLEIVWLRKFLWFRKCLSFWVEQFPKISRWKILIQDHNPRELKTGNVLIFSPILSHPIFYLCIAEFYLEKEGNAFYLFHTITWNFQLILNKIAWKLKQFLVGTA